MSLILAMNVREGIVMASDSRLTIDHKEKQDEKSISHFAVGFSDSNYKTFLAPNNIGISTCGAANIEGVPIAGFIESFINEHLLGNNIDVDNVPKKLLEYFSKFDPIPKTSFYIAGYLKTNNVYEQRIWLLSLEQKTPKLLTLPGTSSVWWNGEIDILCRIIYNAGTLNTEKNFMPFPFFNIPYNFFTLQDAIDFCIFGIRSTIDAIRFQPRPKTVGGPIDVLVIKPDTAFWLQKKELHI